MAVVNDSIPMTSTAAIPMAAPTAILTGPYGQPYTIISSPIPRPSRAEALVRLAYSGVCHGDVYSRNGGGPAPVTPTRPLIGGHEGVGTIVALGDGSAKELPNAAFRIGDIVGIAWRSFVCGTCEPCTLGAENHCTRQQVTGMHRDGTYQCAPCRFLLMLEVFILKVKVFCLQFFRLYRVPSCGAGSHPPWNGSGKCLSNSLRWRHRLYISADHEPSTREMVCHCGCRRRTRTSSNSICESDGPKGPCYRRRTTTKGVFLQAEGR
jgi:hypothetical protein